MDTKTIRSTPPFGLRLNPDLKEWVKQQAKKDRRSINGWLTKLIEDHKDAVK